jgi:hypothetical protein
VVPILRIRLGLRVMCCLLAIGVAASSAACSTEDPPASAATMPTEQPSASSTKVDQTPSAAPVSPPAAKRTLHYISNVGDDRSAVVRLGYNLIDTGPSESVINSLPRGVRALVWLGNLDNTNCTPGFSWSEFKAAVDKLAGNSKVFGYFISDEPHPTVCPDAVKHIRARADYIRSRDRQQVSFIVVLDKADECGANVGCEYSALRPELSHVDLIGIDPFPCVQDQGCNFDKINDRVTRAMSNGIPRSAIVPVIQTFGQTCDAAATRHYYFLPSASQLREILARFAKLTPHPVFDYTYTWDGKTSACPSLDRADGTQGLPDLQSVMRLHNAAG